MARDGLSEWERQWISGRRATPYRSSEMAVRTLDIRRSRRHRPGRQFCPADDSPDTAGRIPALRARRAAAMRGRRRSAEPEAGAQKNKGAPAGAPFHWRGRIPPR